MNSSVGVESVHPDIVALATKATELFLTDLARKAFENFKTSSNVLDYEDMQKLIHTDPRYDFLVDTAPARIKFSDALLLHEEKLKNEPPPYIPFKPKTKAKAKAKAQPKVDETDPTVETTNEQETEKHEQIPEASSASPPPSTEPSSPLRTSLKESDSEQ